MIEERKINGEIKIFEESIIIIKADEDLFLSKTEDELLSYFKDNIPELKYENVYGEEVTIRIVKLVDYFEILDDIKVENFTEVYSRHFIEKVNTSIEDIMKKYYL